MQVQIMFIEKCVLCIEAHEGELFVWCRTLEQIKCGLERTSSTAAHIKAFPLPLMF
jgi:hypothetical protein